MSKPETFSSTITIRRKFEELPLFWRAVPAFGEARAISWRGARLDGEFEVEYNLFTQDRVISNVWVLADNGKFGEEAADRMLNLNADDDERFYLLVLDAIENQYGEHIEEMIQDEISEINAGGPRAVDVVMQAA